MKSFPLIVGKPDLCWIKSGKRCDWCVVLNKWNASVFAQTDINHFKLVPCAQCTIDELNITLTIEHSTFL